MGVSGSISGQFHVKRRRVACSGCAGPPLVRAPARRRRAGACARTVTASGFRFHEDGQSAACGRVRAAIGPGRRQPPLYARVRRWRAVWGKGARARSRRASHGHEPDHGETRDLGCARRRHSQASAPLRVAVCPGACDCSAVSPFGATATPGGTRHGRSAVSPGTAGQQSAIRAPDGTIGTGAGTGSTDLGGARQVTRDRTVR